MPFRYYFSRYLVFIFFPRYWWLVGWLVGRVGSLFLFRAIDGRLDGCLAGPARFVFPALLLVGCLVGWLGRLVLFFRVIDGRLVSWLVGRVGSVNFFHATDGRLVGWLAGWAGSFFLLSALLY